jgi:cohesin complex subunit SA-1/2
VSRAVLLLKEQNAHPIRQQESNLAYPLVSKSKAYKKFRTSLSSFLSRLYAAAASSEILYDTNFCDLFQAWIQSLSSSKIRAFRHTATVVALLTVVSLNSVHVTVTKEHGQANRAKEAEQKKGRKDKARLKDLEKRATAVHERQTEIEEYLDLLYEG